MRPFRGEIRFTLAAEDIDDAIRLVEELGDWIDAPERVFFEGDNVGVMDDHDVVDGSPLDLRLRSTERAEDAPGSSPTR